MVGMSDPMTACYVTEQVLGCELPLVIPCLLAARRVGRGADALENWPWAGSRGHSYLKRFPGTETRLVVPAALAASVTLCRKMCPGS